MVNYRHWNKKTTRNIRKVTTGKTDIVQMYVYMYSIEYRMIIGNSTFSMKLRGLSVGWC